MKRTLFAAVLITILLPNLNQGQEPGQTPAQGPQKQEVRQIERRSSDEDPLTNDDIVEMIQKGLSADFVITKIRASVCNCDVSADALVELRSEGVPELVLKEMLVAAAKAAEIAKTKKLRATLSLRCIERTGESTDPLNRTDEVYVTAVTVKDPKQPSSSRPFHGDMNTSDLQNVTGILVWDGTLKPGEKLQLIINVFEEDNGNLEPGLQLADAIQKQIAAAALAVSGNVEAAALLEKIDTAGIIAKACTTFGCKDADDHIGTYTAIIENNNGKIAVDLFPNTNAQKVGTTMSLVGGARFESSVATEIR